MRHSWKIRVNVRVSTLGAAELSDAVPGAFPRG